KPTPTPTPTLTPAPTITDDQLFAQNITDVFFDYDKADLRPDGQQMLARAAQMIKQKGWHVQIEGHADERGSTEYNLALGERRSARNPPGLGRAPRRRGPPGPDPGWHQR